jgi:hypothetical protein
MVFQIGQWGNIRQCQEINALDVRSLGGTISAASMTFTVVL